MEHYECVTQEYFQLTSFSTSSIFQLGTLQSYKWENRKDDPVWNTARTFFGNISSVPKVFLMGTPLPHNQDCSKCTENSLPLENLECSSSGHSFSPPVGAHPDSDWSHTHNTLPLLGFKSVIVLRSHKRSRWSQETPVHWFEKVFIYLRPLSKCKKVCTKNETNIFCCKQASAVAQIKILGEARRRGEEGLPDWSNIARRDTAVDLEVGPSDIAAVAGSN